MELFKVLEKNDFFDVFYNRFITKFSFIKIAKSDVFAIFLIILDEIESQLFKDKKVLIENFGEFKLTKHDRKTFFDVNQKKLLPCSPKNRIFFTLHEGVSKMLKNHLDLTSLK